MSDVYKTAQFVDPKGGFVYDKNMRIILAQGTTVPTDATAGYARGALFFDLDAVAGAQVFINEGAEDSCDFNAIPSTALLNQVAVIASRNTVLSGAQTLTAADHGKTFSLALAGGFQVILPPISTAKGMMVKFLVQVAPTTAYTIVTGNSTENKMVGSILTIDVNSATDADFEATGGDTFSFVANKAVIGDQVTFECDGSFWYAQASVSVFDAATITTAS